MKGASGSKWLKVAATVHDDPRVEIICPVCGLGRIDFRFIADQQRMGFLVMWCPGCLHGFRISRVRVPDSVDFIRIDDDELIGQEIPGFVEDG